MLRGLGPGTEGEPRISELAPQAGAARLAARIPGKQVELALRSADGRLRVLWRAVIHDGGNYVRQELEITAREDLHNPRDRLA